MHLLRLGLFALAALSPVLLLALAVLQGGLWCGLALIYMGLAALTLDTLLPLASAQGDDREFPVADVLLVALGLCSLALLPGLTWAIAGPGPLGASGRIALLVAGGLWFGQVAHPAAHELIHRPRPLFWLGLSVYTSLLFGHHTSSHRLVHHVYVASPDDPNSARLGEGFYRFARRAATGSFRRGWQAETRLRASKPAAGLHPYALYLGGALACLTLAAVIAGPLGVLVWAALGLHAASQILLSDYVQHYGLRRPPLASGKLAPVSGRESWNAPHWFSSALMLNAPRHSDHHTHPARRFTALDLPPGVPMLPWPLPLACLIALSPRLWRRKMAPVVALATDGPAPPPLANA